MNRRKPEPTGWFPALAPGPAEPPLPIADPAVPAAAAPRLNRQQAAILDAFRRAPGGKLSNIQLLGYSIRYSARIHELRKAGHRIDLTRHDHDTGRTEYTLIEPTPETGEPDR